MGQMKILVTGGAGFIGSHLARSLIEEGHDVRIMDNLSPQVHGQVAETGLLPGEFVRADVRDPDAWSSALQDVEVVFHQAAVVGVAQSMYEVANYVEVNSLGTALLLDYMANQEHDIRGLIVASSMSIYGEGAYQCSDCGGVEPGLRNPAELKRGIWEPLCPSCGSPLRSVPTKEEKKLRPASVYASTKRDQEEICLQIGAAYGIPTVALRYFNAYGPGQSLSNPYTGVCAIFSSRVKAHQPPLIYEDGQQMRDFVNIRDVVQANLLAMKTSSMGGQYFNVGTGSPTSIRDVARTIIEFHEVQLEPEITGEYRVGDIRHCYADIGKISRYGFQPEVDIREGITELCSWAKDREASDHSDRATSELERRGLLYE